MLREQMAENLPVLDCNLEGCKRFCDVKDNQYCKKQLQYADQILALVQQEIKGMENPFPPFLYRETEISFEKTCKYANPKYLQFESAREVILKALEVIHGKGN